MIFSELERYYFCCNVIGPVSTIHICTKSTLPDFGFAICDNGTTFEIPFLSDFLALAAVLGCEIKAY